MLKAILQFILTLLLGYLFHLILPFWAITLSAALVALFFVYRYSAVSFAAGFLAGFLLWMAFAWWLDSENSNLLSSQLGSLFRTDGFYLRYVSGLTGGLLGGMGALTGSLARKIFSQNKMELN